MKADTKFVIYLGCAVFSIALQVLANLWRYGLDLSQERVTALSELQVGLPLVAFPMILALFLARPGTPGQLMLYAVLFVVVSAVGGFFATMLFAFVLTSWR